jgi:hypothetical protein
VVIPFVDCVARPTEGGVRSGLPEHLESVAFGCGKPEGTSEERLAFLCADSGIEVLVHAFLDGRDTPPESAREFLAAFAAETPGIAIVTVGGRYYAMDRDKRWERLALAYGTLVEGAGERAASADAAVLAGYARGESDEFVKPTAIGGYDGMRDGDGLLMTNFRADRVRQLMTAPEFVGHIIFLEDYDLQLARWLVSGVDVWLNTPRRPYEASGTSGMKAVRRGPAHPNVGRCRRCLPGRQSQEANLSPGSSLAGC